VAEDGGAFLLKSSPQDLSQMTDRVENNSESLVYMLFCANGLRVTSGATPSNILLSAATKSGLKRCCDNRIFAHAPIARSLLIGGASARGFLSTLKRA
jgi:hypothetical protein